MDAVMPQDKATLIMEKARSLFIDHGFHGTSMQKLAQAADIASGTLYLHYKNKEELIRAIYRHAIEEVVTVLLQDFQPDRPLYEQYRLFWTNGYSRLSHRQELVQYKDLYERSPFFNDDDREWSTMRWQTLDSFYLQGIESGLFRDLPIPLLGYLSLGSILSIPQTQRIVQFKMTDALKDELIDASWNTILRRDAAYGYETVCA
jgi:TetR/AcrR family transcriptional repressor of multidrug resistance operon